MRFDISNRLGVTHECDRRIDRQNEALVAKGVVCVGQRMSCQLLIGKVSNLNKSRRCQQCVCLFADSEIRIRNRTRWCQGQYYELTL